jgi:uncharacterized membrane protein YkoI
MKVLAILPVLFFATAAAAAATPPAKPYVGHELAAAAQVPLTKAEALALRARPGRITDKELEKEAGGSGLRWSFDIVAKGKTYEVGVDAATGKVLENQMEGRNPD